MPHGLLELVKKGELDAFETRCLELLEAGEVPMGILTSCLKQMERSGAAGRVPVVAQMVLENSDLEANPQAILPVACAGLIADPQNAGLRASVATLYERVHGQTPGFSAILESSGLAVGAPARTALRVLDFCLELGVSDTLISRMDDRVVEVVEVDRERGLFTLRREGRTTTLPAREVVREYERVDSKDFRVLRQLRPEQLPDLIRDDPVAVVTGLIRAHGDLINADELKADLVPRYIDSKQWSKWWTQTRTLLKRSPHIVIEGRSPVVLSYSEEGVSLEDETWAAIAAQDDPVQWLSTAESYLRELKARKHSPDEKLLHRFHNHIVSYIARIRPYRPGEALACALVLGRLGERGLPIDEESKALAAEILREAREPAALLASLTDDGLWSRALAELRHARPDDWPDCAEAVFTRAPATQLDELTSMLREAERLGSVQSCIDDAMADPIDYTDIIYWLWKGPKKDGGLRLPSAGELFNAILDTLSALGVTLHPTPDVTRHFKARIKAALSLREYARVREHLEQLSTAAAVPLRRRIDRLDALGQVARSMLLEALRKAHPQLWQQRVARVEPWQDAEVVWATQAGLSRKAAERDELVNVKMHENAKRIGEAAAHGDLSENAEYKSALEERDFLRARLAQMNHDLSRARALTLGDVPTDHVGIGSRVTLRHVADGAQRVMVILGPFETNVEAGVYNYAAPVCQRILGLRVGQRGAVTIDGTEHELEVVAIESAL